MREVRRTPNDLLTARPRIFVRGARLLPKDEADKWLWDMVGSEPREPVKEFTRAYLTPGTPEHNRFETGISKRDRDTLAALVLLHRVQTHETLSAATKDLCDVAERLIPGWRPPEWAIGGNWRECAARTYASYLGQAMKTARLVMARAKPGQPYLPVVLCPDLRSAAFAFAAYRGVEVCAGCRSLFAADPERDQKYCSGACAQRRYQRQYRLREKRKRAAKKSKRSKVQRKRGG